MTDAALDKIIIYIQSVPPPPPDDKERRWMLAVSFINSRSSRDQKTLSIIQRMVELGLTNPENIKEYGEANMSTLSEKGDYQIIELLLLLNLSSKFYSNLNFENLNAIAK